MNRFVGLRELGSRGAWALVGIMAIVAWLGYQQYRWIIRVAAVEAKTGHEKLEGALQDIRDGFDTEITRAQLAFDGLAGDSSSDVLERASERLETFRRMADYPGLIAAVDIAGELPDPFHVDEGPPPALAVPAMVMRKRGESARGHYLAAQPFVQTGSVPNRTGGEMRTEGNMFRLRLALNQDYVSGVLLPKLLADRLRPNFQDHFDVLVRTAQTGRIVWKSGRADQEPWDESISLFSVRPDCLANGTDRGPVTIFSRTLRTPASILRLSGRCSDMKAPAPGIWILSVRASPSLAATTRFARRQNLAISFGVLAVLATAAATLFVSAYRARELAGLHKQFAAGISHELRTPLSVISSASENLADGVVEDPDQVRAYGNMIHTHSEQLTAMIENALWFARNDRESQLETEEVDVEELVAASAATCGVLLAEAGIKLDREVEPGLPPVRGNRTLLLHGLQNLLANIAQYGRAGKWARVRAQRYGNSVTFTVEDRGPGIPPEEVRRVFQPFYRGSGAKKANVAGLGLGLALARRIVEAHGGQIDLQSQQAVGTTVAFSVPIVDCDSGPTA